MFSNLLGGEVVSAVKVVGNIIDDLFTSDEEVMTLELAKQRLAQNADLVQTEINKVEASHRSIFVAGWRPFIGWVCGFALLYGFIIRDILAWAIVNYDIQMRMPPELALEHLIAVLMGMLGLGGLRTVEKLQGRSK